MLTTRRTPLPPDVQYVLDESLDQDNINAFDHLAITLYADPGVVVDIVDRERPTGRGWHLGLGAMCLELDAYAHSIAVGIPVPEQRALFAAGLVREIPRLTSLAEVMASWNYEDSTVGGALEHYLSRPRIDHALRPTRRVARRLYAPLSIRRYTAICDSAHPRALASTLRKLPWPSSLEEAQELEPAIQQQHANFVVENRRRVEAFFAERRHTAPNKKLKLAEVKKRRQVLVKSAAVAETVLGLEKTASFIKGGTVVLPGEHVDLHVDPGFTRSGMGALAITLYPPGLPERRLANLCLYYDRTPAMDQLAAIALAMQAGEERNLIDAGNIFGETSAALGVPILAERLHRHNAEREAVVREGYGTLRRSPRIRQYLRRDVLDHRCKEYVAEMTPAYLDALIPVIWGSDAHRLRRVCSVER